MDLRVSVASAVLAGFLGSCASIQARSSDPIKLQMIPIEGGEFLLGSPSSQEGHQADEGPQLAVTIPSFRISRFEVTKRQYRAFVEASGYSSDTPCLVMGEDGRWFHDPDASWENPGFAQTEDHPVVCVSWVDAKAYAAWLGERTQGAGYRLPSEAEWEFVAKAGGTSTYWWGEDEERFCAYTNGADATVRALYPEWDRAGECDDGFAYTAPVGTYEKPNVFGAEDMIGNVWEWAADCYTDTHSDAPRDGGAVEVPDCEKRVLRGGAWDFGPFYLRTAYRGAWDGSQAFSNLGFRVAADKRP